MQRLLLYTEFNLRPHRFHADSCFQKLIIRRCFTLFLKGKLKLLVLESICHVSLKDISDPQFPLQDLLVMLSDQEEKMAR